jgi:ABC-type antimicrobial peptide transport system permease subunit
MPQGLLAPVRVVLQRSYADWLIVAATWLVILCATALVAIGVMYGDAVAKTGLDRILADEPGTATSIAVEIRASADELPDVESGVEHQVGRILGWTGGELRTITQSETYALPAEDDPDALQPLALFGSYEGIDEHATLVGGAWPRDGAEPVEVAISQPVAESLGLGIRDELNLTSQRGNDRQLSIRIVGVWEANDAADPYWRGDPLELTGTTQSASFATRGPFVVGRDDLIERTASGQLGLEFRALPAFSHLAVDDVNWMRSDTAALERRLHDELGDAAHFQVTTDLDQILESANTSLLVSRSGVVVLTIQFAVLAGYALLLVAGLLVEQRRVETALLRSRGAGTAHIVLMSIIEALILVVPAVVAAPWLAVGVLDLLNVGGPLADAGIRISPHVNETVMIAAAIAGIACIIGLVLPALSAGRGLAMVRQTMSRQGNRTLAQRLGIDLALVVLAGIGLWQLRQYGAPITETVRGSVGLDPLLVAAPAIGLLAGAILALRIVPLAAELGERLLSGRRGLVAPLGARQLSRRPLRYTRAALLLMLASALGTFAGAYASTWTRSQEDQAAYRTASDMRVEVSDFPDLPRWAIGQAYRSVEGVDVAIPVAHGRFDLQDGNGEILALATSEAAGRVSFRADLATEPIDELLGRLESRRAPDAGVILEGEPVGFSVRVTSDLENVVIDESSVPFSPGLRGVTPSVVVRDADGTVLTIPGERMGVGLGEQSSEITLAADLGEGTAVRPAYPLELLGVQVDVELPAGAVGIGRVQVDGLASVEADGEATEINVALFDPFVATESSPINGFGAADPTELEFSLRSTASADEPVAALASASYLELTGTEVGDVVDVGELTARRQFEIVGELGGFPTLDPATPFLVADLGALATADHAAGRELEVGEWWLDTADGAAAGVAATLGNDRFSTASIGVREELHRDLLSDPVALGLIGALALGAMAAIVFAAIGFVVSATVSTRERLGEFALLQAIGLSHRQLSAWLSMENLFLLLVGLLVGTGIGLVLAWVVLPFVTLTQEATIAVPPVEVVIPWGIYGLLYVVAGIALVITVLVIGRLLGRVRVSGVLRAGGE